MSMAGRPAFDWEQEPPRGEGRGGNYLAHLRERGYFDQRRKEKTMAESVNDLCQQYKLSPDSGYRVISAVSGFTGDEARSRWKRAMFAFRYGGGPALDFVSDIKEAPMKASITVTVEAEKLSDLVHALLDLNEAEGVEITDVDETGVSAAVKDAVIPEPEADPDAPIIWRPCTLTGQAAIKEYLQRVTRGTTNTKEITVTYVSVLTGQRTIRKVVPTRVAKSAGRDVVYARDVRLDMPRTFVIENIESIEVQ